MARLKLFREEGGREDREIQASRCDLAPHFIFESIYFAYHYFLLNTMPQLSLLAIPSFASIVLQRRNYNLHKFSYNNSHNITQLAVKPTTDRRNIYGDTDQRIYRKSRLNSFGVLNVDIAASVKNRAITPIGNSGLQQPKVVQPISIREQLLRN